MESLLRPFLFLSLSLVFGVAASQACTLRPDYNPKTPVLLLPKSKPSSWEQESFFSGLLVQILERTREEYGPCEIAFTPEMVTRMRSVALINQNHSLDLLWGSTTLERDTLLKAIPVPLLKGLMGYRVLLIRPQDQARFSVVKNLEDLQELRAGQGADWPDTSILMTNGIRVVTSINYEALYRMLAGGRFDFLPRGANQVLSELRHNAGIDIVVEKELVLIYPAPHYFFVDRENTRLAERISKGLHSMIDDGSFDRYFYSHPLIREALTELRLHERRPIYLQNPLLPEGAPMAPPDYWLKVPHHQ